VKQKLGEEGCKHAILSPPSCTSHTLHSRSYIGAFQCCENPNQCYSWWPTPCRIPCSLQRTMSSKPGWRWFQWAYGNGSPGLNSARAGSARGRRVTRLPPRAVDLLVSAE
jgi:hypothetical protein